MQQTNGLSKGIAKLIRSLEQRKYRELERLFVGEGHKVVGELSGTFTLRHLLVSDRFTAEYPGMAERWMATGNAHGGEGTIGVHWVSEDDLARASLLQHPQGVIGVFVLPDEAEATLCLPEQGLCLALDGVQDPGNVGTIIRMADWFGVECVFLSPACADAFAPKVVQATMGALARVRTFRTDLPVLLRSQPADLPVCGTSLNGANLYSAKLPVYNKGVVVMGSEGNGLSPQVASLLTHNLRIPSFPAGRPTSESLNVAVATAIVLAELRRRESLA